MVIVKYIVGEHKCEYCEKGFLWEYYLGTPPDDKAKPGVARCNCTASSSNELMSLDTHCPHCQKELVFECMYDKVKSSKELEKHSLEPKK